MCHVNGAQFVAPNGAYEILNSIKRCMVMVWSSDELTVQKRGYGAYFSEWEMGVPHVRQ